MEAVNAPAENIPELNGKAVNGTSEKFLSRGCWPLKEDEEKLMPFVVKWPARTKTPSRYERLGIQCNPELKGFSYD